MSLVDVLIPTYQRPAALAVTLTSLIFQEFSDFSVVISDQNEELNVADKGEVAAAVRVLRLHHKVNICKHLPRKGMAEQRQFLLQQSQSAYALFLDDDLILEPYVIRNLVQVIERYRCGFTGNAVLGLSFIEDLRPEEEQIEFWEGEVEAEEIRSTMPEWKRFKLHNAANLYHVQKRLGISQQDPRPYKVAWVGGCVLYDRSKLESVGGFQFWKDLPMDHAGEDVLAQQRVMARYGGCGVIPSGVYHQELPTTVEDRRINAPEVLDLNLPR